MANIHSLTEKEIPPFIRRFLSSRYVANFLGFFVPNFDDIREFVLAKADRLEASFIKKTFLDFDEKPFFDGFDERLTIDNIEPMIKYLLKHFDEAKQFFEEKDEIFRIEIHFQLPFIHKSCLKSAEKKGLLSVKKVHYFNTFRENLRGRFFIISADEETGTFLSEGYIIRDFSVENDKYRFFLAYPVFLKSYWDLVLQKIEAKS